MTIAVLDWVACSASSERGGACEQPAPALPPDANTPLSGPPPQLSCQPRSQATPAPPWLGPTHPSVRAPHATRACGVSTQGGGSLIFGGAAAGRRASVRRPRRACGGPCAGERPCTRPYTRSPAPCWLWTSRCPSPVSSPLVQASRLLPGVGGLSAVLPDRLCLPLSLGRGKPGGSPFFLWSCRFLTPPTRPSPPPPEPSPWLRTSRATRLRMRTPPGCFAPRAVAFSGMLASACEGLTETCGMTCGMTGCFFAARFSTVVRAFSVSGGVLGWWDGAGGYVVVHRVEDSVAGGHCAGRARLVSICCT